MFIHIFTTITNVVLVSFLATVFIAMEIIYAKREKPQKVTFLQGILLGLGFIVKTNMLSLLFAYVILFFSRWKKLKQNFIFKINEAAVFILGFLLPSGWYILRSQRLYGRPFEFFFLKDLDPASYHLTLLERVGVLNYWNSFVLTIFKTFWSGYGALTVNFPQIINLILLMFSLLIILSIIKSYKGLSESLKICVFYAIAIFIWLVLVNFKFSAMHAKDLFLAYLPLALLTGYGLVKAQEIIKKRSFFLWQHLFVIFISVYFFAQREIVLLIKGNPILYFGVLVLKIIAVIIIYWTALLIFEKISFSKNFPLTMTLGLFYADLLILVVTTYLFYFKFI